MSKVAALAVDENEKLADKIVHILTVYPMISPSMLQIGLGPAVSPSIWKPILEGLIESGTVIRTNVLAETPSGRQNTYMRLELDSDIE